MHRSAMALAGDRVAVLHTRVRREQLRWLSLHHLDVVRPSEMTDGALLALVRADYTDVDLRELRRELDYLVLAELLTVTIKRDRWRLRLTRQGVDIVEYTVHCPVGIGRPPPPST